MCGRDQREKEYYIFHKVARVENIELFGKYSTVMHIISCCCRSCEIPNNVCTN